MQASYHRHETGRKQTSDRQDPDIGETGVDETDIRQPGIVTSSSQVLAHARCRARETSFHAASDFMPHHAGV
jgi:hypothetical protein